MELAETDFEKYSYAHVHTWALMGFRFLLCESKGDHSIITPCLFEIPHQLLTRFSTQYQIPISDEQCFEMAEGVDEFDFYTQPIELISSCVSIQNN
jgi:hypothetical protein